MKYIIALVVCMASTYAMALGWEVHVKMPDGKILVFEQGGASDPNKSGMYMFKANGKTFVVHASNVWFIKK